MTTRKQVQADLLFKLGLLLSPLYDIVEHPENYDAIARSRAAGKFAASEDNFLAAVLEFTKDDPGHNYYREWQQISYAMASVRNGTNSDLHDMDKLKALLMAKTQELQEKLLSIPALTEAVILEAHTPFSSYCLIKDLCQATGQQLVLTDRYLTGKVYYRFFRDIPSSVQITLITWPQTKRKASEWTDLMDVSRMYAAERPNSYCLLVNENFHDRWLWLDDQIFSLGGSLGEVGTKNDFTLTRIDPTPANRQQIEDVINNSTELFGQSQQKHP